jgi:hypothetical protein
MSREWLEVPLNITDKIGEFFIWAGFRVIVATPALLIHGWKQIARLNLHLAEIAERSYSKILIVFDSLPYGGLAGSRLIEVEAKAIPSSFEVCTDILEVLDGKHGLLIGGTGDGKTTTAMYIAYSIGGRIKVYDADAAADEWLGLEVIGRCADFAAIDTAMKADIDELQERTILRGEKGSHACDGMDAVTIAEEFPLLVGEVESASSWLIKHGKRGRRVKKFILAIAQNDTVANFGIQGDSGVMDCFRVIRLGKKAIAYARKLKNPALEEWLRGDRSRILVDDIPVQLPPYREIQRVIQQGSLGYTHLPPQLLQGYPTTTENSPNSPLEATENQDFQPMEADFSDSPESLLERILAAFREGKSDDWITKNIFGATGGNSYYKAKERVANIRARLGGRDES